MRNQLTVTQIGPDIWQFSEANESGPFVDAYLIGGAQRALMVDTLCTLTGLYDKVRELTDLPIDVLITHGHLDHAGPALEEFKKAGCGIYMDMRDYDMLASGADYPVSRQWFTDAPDGLRFSLGGYDFEVISIPGHSQGSLVILDAEKQLLFSGDSIGAGQFWMHIPSALPLVEFCRYTEKLYRQTKELESLLIYPGHRHQSPVQLTGQYIKDIWTVTKRIISGAIKGEPREMNFHDGKTLCLSVQYGMIQSYCYEETRIFSQGPDSPREKIKDRFRECEVLEDARGIRYMFFEPETERGQAYPMVLFLHGAGERGRETRRALANDGPVNFAAEDWQSQHPCFVMAPQCPEDTSWNDGDIQLTVVNEMMGLLSRYPIDKSRIYVTGLSMGGMGTWRFISSFPHVFAAAMPICGGAYPAAVAGARHVPVWAFHAADDPIVPCADCFPGLSGEANLYGTATVVAALRGTGNPEVNYTEYPAGYMEKTLRLFPHASWIPAYANREALDWMFAQSRYDKYEVEWIMPGVWHIEDYADSSFYLVEGEEKALLIDTGMGGGSIMETVKSLTRLPVELALTHAHPDHMLHCDQFERFHMSHKEESVLPVFLDMLPGKKDLTADTVMSAATDIKHGDVIDLGGTEIEVIEVAGHSPGSVAYYDRRHRIIFSGDILGVWLQVPGALTISEYKEQLLRFDGILENLRDQNIFFLGGHRRQEGMAYPYGREYVPNSIDRVKNMIKLCDMVLNDDAELLPFKGMGFGKRAYIASLNGVTMVLNDDVKK